MRYIGFEGPIGAGKTTLVRALEQRLNGKVILEQADENPFLERFYQDKERYAFQAQIFFLLSRYQQQRQILQGDLFHEYFLGDYVFSRDTIFARMTLSEDELGLYSTIYNALVEQIPQPDLVVYLRQARDADGAGADARQGLRGGDDARLPARVVWHLRRVLSPLR